MGPLYCQIFDKNVGRSKEDASVQNIALYSETVEDQILFLKRNLPLVAKKRIQIFPDLIFFFSRFRNLLTQPVTILIDFQVLLNQCSLWESDGMEEVWYYCVSSILATCNLIYKTKTKSQTPNLRLTLFLTTLNHSKFQRTDKFWPTYFEF